MKPASARGRAIARSDIDVLGQEVNGFDPARYFDWQDQEAAQAAALRWPLVASLLGYVGPAPLEDRGLSTAATRGRVAPTRYD